MFLIQHLKDSRVLISSLLLVFGAYVIYSPNYDWSESYGNVPFAADFLQEWVGARMILAGDSEQLYSNQFIKNQHDPQFVGFAWDAEEFFPAVYPPPHYLLFSPFGLLPYQWAGLVWLFLQILFVYVTWIVLKPLAVCRENKTQSCAQSPSLWLGILLFPPLLFSIAVAQKSTLWMMMIAVAMSMLIRGKDLRGGLVFGLLSIKPTLFFLLPLIALKQKRWKFLFGCFSSACLLWGTSLIAMPVTVWSGFLEVARGAGAFAANGGYRAEWSCNLLTMAYCMSPQMIGWGKLAMCLPLAIYVVHSVLFNATNLDRPGTWLMVLASTALLSPHFYYYDLCILLPALVGLWAINPRESVAVYVLLAVACSLSSPLLQWLSVPVFPIMLIGIVSWLALQSRWTAVVRKDPPKLDLKGLLSR